ncbi:hypothetical protein GCM10009854_27230 [Saccharopolyspora halophila]|uniref:DUF742 domain-containing protein n=1 Tax=Saccharopolyspora halophila TaxID=405551 RepID=A0ABN3GC89_9PSEU
MSTGPDPTGQHRRPDDPHADGDGVAEVFARFTLDSGRRRGRRRKRAQEDPGPHDAAQSPQPSRTEAGHDEQAAPPAAESWPKVTTGAADGAGATDNAADSGQPRAEYDTDDQQAAYIRPYAWTGGRTRSNQELELETLVSVSEMFRPDRLLRTEHHTIAEICKHPRSVAEVGALLGVPLGVAKVLVSDMAELGLLTVHDTVSDSSSSSHFLLMERVLSGLRRL